MVSQAFSDGGVSLLRAKHAASSLYLASFGLSSVSDCSLMTRFRRWICEHSKVRRRIPDLVTHRQSVHCRSRQKQRAILRFSNRPFSDNDSHFEGDDS